MGGWRKVRGGDSGSLRTARSTAGALTRGVARARSSLQDADGMNCEGDWKGNKRLGKGNLMDADVTFDGG